MLFDRGCGRGGPLGSPKKRVLTKAVKAAQVSAVEAASKTLLTAGSESRQASKWPTKLARVSGAARAEQKRRRGAMALRPRCRASGLFDGAQVPSFEAL